MEIYAVKFSRISGEELKKLCLLVDLEKKYKIDKFINEKDKIRTIIGEILVKTIIVEKLRVSKKYIKFDKNQYGKPYLKSYQNFNFNISHSGNYVLCAVDDKPIGIDVEEIKPIECKEIAKSFFTEKEFEYIFKHDFEFQLDRFYQIWTLKESYIKCCGQGLSIPLKTFSIEMNQDENIKVIINDKYEEHTLKLLDIELGYKAAICSLNKEISNNIIRLDQNYLISKYIGFNFE